MSASLDAVPNASHHHTAGSAWDSDMDVEADPPEWQSSLTEEELSRLHSHEKKRQDVINGIIYSSKDKTDFFKFLYFAEFFDTERSHVRNLIVLENIFLQKIQTAKILKQEEVNLVFANVNEVLDIHSQFNKVMKNKRKEAPVVKEVGDIILNMVSKQNIK